MSDAPMCPVEDCGKRLVEDWDAYRCLDHFVVVGKEN